MDLLERLKQTKISRLEQFEKPEPRSDKSNITVVEFAKNHMWLGQLLIGLEKCSWLSHGQKLEIENTKVFIHHKLGRAAGLAQWAPKRRILLHPVYADQIEASEFAAELKETFFHEVAHFCAFYGDDMKHGHLWKAAMWAFDYVPRACYDGALYDYKNYKNRKERRFLEMLQKYMKEGKE